MILHPGQTMTIDPGYESLKIRNVSPVKNGACNIFFDSGSQNVQIPPGQTVEIPIHKNPCKVDNVGSTDLDVTPQ